MRLGAVFFGSFISLIVFRPDQRTDCIIIIIIVVLCCCSTVMLQYLLF